MKILLALALVLLGPLCLATTWDEPWQEQIVLEAESLVRAQVVKNRPESMDCKLVKLLAGKPVPETFTVAGYWSLHLASISSTKGAEHELQFTFPEGSETYLLLKAAPQGGTYQLPTPTAGFADIHGDVVYATYRHSYHQAAVPIDLYERSMSVMFHCLKKEPYDAAWATAFIGEQLAQPPSAWQGEEKDPAGPLFFRQHVALELLRYLGAETDLPRIAPFLASSNWHLQVSACRALAGIRAEASQQAMIAFIEGKGDAFAKVMCVWGLRQQGAKALAPRLRAYLGRGGKEECGFGGNLMDPRIGTRFPQTVQDAIREALGDLEKP